MGKQVMAEQQHRRQASRSLLRMAAGAALGLLLAGCQVVPGGGPRPLPPAVEVEPPPVQVPVVTPKPVPEEERNHVAVLVPITGQNARVGQSIANAANLALLDTGGKEIRITVYDTAGGAAAAASRALAEGNGLILGPLLAEDVRAVAPIAREGNVPVIAFSNDVSVAGNGVYLMGFNPAQSIDRVVRYARTQNIERFAGVAPEGNYGRRASQALIGAVERAGGRMVAMQAYSGTPQSLRTAVTKLNGQSGYDAVLIGDTGRAAASIAPMIRSGPSGDARMLGTELWKTEADLGAAAALQGAWFASVPDGIFNQLRERYRARYSVTPYRLASLGYDAVLLAVRIGGEWRAGRPFPEDELRDPEGFTGVDGAFRFGGDGVAERRLEVVQVGPGGHVVVSPAAKDFSD